MAYSWLKRKPVRKSGAVPMYVQVAEILDEEVKARQGERFSLPSEGELACEFGVSRVTIRQALKQLEIRRQIYSEHGRGYFAERQPLPSLGDLACRISCSRSG